MTIAENIARVRENIASACLRAGRPEEEVKLIAVTKYVEEERIAQAFDSGLRTVGENHAQEVREKLNFYKQNGAELHFIGQLQSNKVKYIIGNVRLIQSADREKLLLDLEEHARKLDLVQGILLQVNIGAEAQKGGVPVEDVPYLLELACGLKHLRVEGFMCVPPDVDAEAARLYFARLYELREKLRPLFPELPLKELSMGMSHDYPQAIMEGATMVRVGTAIFGKRNKQ